MVTLNNNEIIKKNNIININIECCRIIDSYGYLYYIKQNGETISEKEKDKILNSFL